VIAALVLHARPRSDALWFRRQRTGAWIMRTLLSKGFIGLVLMWGLIGGPAQAAPVPAADAKLAQRVIQAQLNAFAADDAKRAFSYAAPTIRAQFGTADNFLAMVRQGYPMVYRPANVTFFKPELISGTLIQTVQFADLEGGEWVATYHLERQRNKAWRISACVVEPRSGSSA
jgi:Domain of unknown function (DUF4864)